MRDYICIPAWLLLIDGVILFLFSTYLLLEETGILPET